MSTMSICKISGLGFWLQDGLSGVQLTLAIHPLFDTPELEDTLRLINNEGHKHKELLAPAVTAVLIDRKLLQHTSGQDLHAFTLMLEKDYSTSKLFNFFQFIYTMPDFKYCPKYHPNSGEHANLEHYLVDCQKSLSNLINYNSCDAESEALARRNEELTLDRLMGWETKERDINRPRKSFNLHTVVNRVVKHVNAIQAGNKLVLSKKGSASFISACRLIEGRDLDRTVLERMLPYIEKLRSLGKACGYVPRLDSDIEKDLDVIITHVESIIDAQKLGLDIADDFAWLDGGAE